MLRPYRIYARSYCYWTIGKTSVKKIFLLSLILTFLGVILLLNPNREPSVSPSKVAQSTLQKNLRYESYTKEQNVVHTLLIPSFSRFSVRIALSEDLSTLESFAKKHQAVAVINGGFFDPQNGKSTAIIVVQGQMVADPSRNERLMNNPQLKPYLQKILNRTEFRRYRCGAKVRYDIVLHTEETPSECQLEDTLGGGPSLLPKLTLVQEGFLDFSKSEVIRDPLGSSQPNARSAVGITDDGSILLVMVAQKPESPTNSGMSLQELAEFMKNLGVEKAMNLDGGSSSSFYYNGKNFYGKVKENGNVVKRSVLSVLLIQETSENF